MNSKDENKEWTIDELEARYFGDDAEERFDDERNEEIKRLWKEVKEEFRAFLEKSRSESKDNAISDK